MSALRVACPSLSRMVHFMKIPVNPSYEKSSTRLPFCDDHVSAFVYFLSSARAT